METFTVYGSEYPRDGQHAELMAQYLAPPSINATKWNLIRDWAEARAMTAEYMTCFLHAIDIGAANIILNGPVRTEQDLDKIACSLQVNTSK
jgi:hypothetical protein